MRPAKLARLPMRKHRPGTSLHCVCLETLPQLHPRDIRGKDGWGPGPSPFEPACLNPTKAEGQELPGSGCLEACWISTLDPG